MTVRYQEPAAGISLNQDFIEAATFTVNCDCHDPSHSVNMWISAEPDDEFQEVSVTFYVNAVTPWYEKGFSRLRTAWRVLVHGYHEEEATLMLNKQSAVNFAQTILKYVDRFEKKKVDK